MRPSRHARSQLSGRGPVDPLTRAVKEPVTSTMARATTVSVERMGESLLVAGFYSTAGLSTRSVPRKASILICEILAGRVINGKDFQIPYGPPETAGGNAAQSRGAVGVVERHGCPARRRQRDGSRVPGPAGDGGTDHGREAGRARGADDRRDDGGDRSTRARRIRAPGTRRRGSTPRPRRSATQKFQTCRRTVSTAGREYGATARGI